MKKGKYLSSGEFAKLCRTTKETLFHYDREGLLKPRHISGNGYRRYGMEQFFDFDMIAMLKETGSSLKEIRQYISTAGSADFLRLLEEKRRVVRQERVRLARREAALMDMAAQTREALSLDYDRTTFVPQAEERLEILPTRPMASDSVADFVSRFVEYINYYEKQERAPRYPFGAIVSLNDALEKRHEERYFFSRATRATPRALVRVKRPGRYAVLAHQGTMQTHNAAYLDMLQDIAAAGLRLAGDVYIYDLMSYILLGTGGEYAAKYCVQVE